MSDGRDAGELKPDNGSKRERQWSLQAFLICPSAIEEDGESYVRYSSELECDSDGMRGLQFLVQIFLT